MPEFRIRNVAVKLMPEEDVAPGEAVAPGQLGCWNFCSMLPTIWTLGCNMAPTVCFNGCTLNVTQVCLDGVTCAVGLSRDPLVARPVDVGAELGVLKEQLRQQIVLIEEQERQIAQAAKPRTVEEIDRLTTELEGAVEELKAQREQLLRGEQAPQ